MQTISPDRATGHKYPGRNLSAGNFAFLPEFLSFVKEQCLCRGSVVQNNHPVKRGTKKAAIHIVAFFLSGCGGVVPVWPDDYP